MSNAFYIPLPAYENPPGLDQNAVGGLSNALSNIGNVGRENAMLALQQQAGNRANAELGLRQQAGQREQTQFNQQQHAAIAQGILSLPPEQQPAALARVAQSDPEWAKDAAAMGFHPGDYTGIAQAMVQRGLGPQNPLDVQQKQAQIEASKAATAASLQSTEAGKLQFSPTGETYVNQGGKWTKQEEEGGGVVKLNADAIASGRQPPVFTNLGRGAVPAAVKAELERRGLNVSELQNEWQRAQAQIKSVNGSQMTRYTGLYKSVDNTIDEANSLAAQMQLSGVPVANKLELLKYIQTEGNSPNGQLATKYMTTINTLKEEFANLAQGGFAPTEPAWELANQQINGNYGVKQLGASLGEVKRLAGLRYHAIPGMDTVGPDAANRYLPQQSGAQPAPAQRAPAATAPAVPPGWKIEQVP